ncbi:MAG TPA: helix-turn-helix domain-containing protein [Gemmatimonadaceae bacterium]|nr:helix-turn-helix domain-containing protein [Gemmatimonadaceae bacterium]
MPTPRSSTPQADLAAIATVLTPTERLRVDAAGEGIYRALHRESIDDVIRDLKERPLAAVIVSVARCDDLEATRMAAVVREFPRIPAVALLTGIEGDAAQAVLALGRSGVRTLIDVRQPTGWRELRDVLIADHTDDIQRLALGQLAIDLAGAPADCWRFFEGIFRSSPRVATIRALSRQLGVLPSTLMSRFFRSKLPPPKRYLAMARLTRAARLFENSGLSVANVANHLDYSSPQSFGRHVRTVVGLTAVAFRERYDGEGMLQRFREELVLPYQATLRVFMPLTAPPGWVPGRGSGARGSSPKPRTG